MLLYLIDSNTPFRAIESTTFNSMIRNVYPRWKSVNRKTLVDKVLPRCARRTIEYIIRTLKHKNVTVVVDEFSSKQGAFLNFVLVSTGNDKNNPSRYFFWKRIHLKEALNASSVAEYIVMTIHELEAKSIHVAAYASDSCAVMKSSEKIIQKSFPSIRRAPCASHMLNNTFKDIIELEGVHTLWRIVNHHLLPYI